MSVNVLILKVSLFDRFFSIPKIEKHIPNHLDVLEILILWYSKKWSLTRRGYTDGWNSESTRDKAACFTTPNHSSLTEGLMDGWVAVSKLAVILRCVKCKEWQNWITRKYIDSIRVHFPASYVRWSRSVTWNPKMEVDRWKMILPKS